MFEYTRFPMKMANLSPVMCAHWGKCSQLQTDKHSPRASYPTSYKTRRRGTKQCRIDYSCQVSQHDTWKFSGWPKTSYSMWPAASNEFQE